MQNIHKNEINQMKKQKEVVLSNLKSLNFSKLSDIMNSKFTGVSNKAMSKIFFETKLDRNVKALPKKLPGHLINNIKLPNQEKKETNEQLTLNSNIRSKLYEKNFPKTNKKAETLEVMSNLESNRSIISVDSVQESVNSSQNNLNKLDSKITENHTNTLEKIDTDPNLDLSSKSNINKYNDSSTKILESTYKKPEKSVYVNKITSNVCMKNNCCCYISHLPLIDDNDVKQIDKWVTMRKKLLAEPFQESLWHRVGNQSHSELMKMQCIHRKLNRHKKITD